MTPEHDDRTELVVARDPGIQPAGREHLEGDGQLAVADLDEQVTAGGEPVASAGSDPTQQVEAVDTSVEGGPWLVLACLGGQQSNFVGGHVRGVGGQHVDPAPQMDGQRGEEVTEERPLGRDVAPCHLDGDRINVRRPHLGVGDLAPDGRGDRPDTAAQLHGHAAVGKAPDRLLREQLGAPAGDEHSRRDVQSQAAEGRPAEHLLQRLARDPAGHLCGYVATVTDEQFGLLLGKHAAGGAEGGHHVVVLHPPRLGPPHLVVAGWWRAHSPAT